MKRLSNRIVSLDASILDALKRMDQQRVKLLLVFEGQCFKGILTIGDIQRAIIRGISLHEPILSIVDNNKIYASESDSVESIKAEMSRLRAECMPVLDSSGNLIKVYFWEDFFDNRILDRREKINIPVVIMAGGKGTRLRPLTNVLPKPLVPIGEKTILEEILNQFERIGCAKFYMSVNYKADIIQYYLNQLEHKYDITLFREDKPLGTIGSVSLLKGQISSPFFVSNCDNLIDQDFRDVYDYHVSNNNEMTIVTAIKTMQIPYGVIECGDNGILTDLKEKPESTYMINSGVYILNPDLIDEIPEGQFFHITDLMGVVRKRGGRIGCFPVSENSWKDMGDWTEYLKLINVL